MTRSVISYSNVNSTPTIPNPNLLYNGSFQVWQRSFDTDNTGTSWGYRTADRWYTNKGRTLKTATDAIPNVGYMDAMRITPSADGTYNGGRGLIYKHEWFRDFQETLTLSFYLKASAAGNVTIGNVYDYDTSSSVAPAVSTAVTTSWQRYSVTINCSTAPATQPPAMYIINNLVDGVTYEVAAVKLERGSTATPFEKPNFTEEFTNCARYYWRYHNQHMTGQARNWLYNIDDNDSYRRGVMQFPVTMRTTPACSASFAGNVGSSQGLQHISNQLANVYVDGSSTHAYMTQFTADAEYS